MKANKFSLIYLAHRVKIKVQISVVINQANILSEYVGVTTHTVTVIMQQLVTYIHFQT